MKRIVILLVCLLSLFDAHACLKNKAAASKGGMTINGYKVTLLVMDSANTLVSDALVYTGRDTIRTSWDGRVELMSGQIGRKGRITVRHDNYEKKTISVDETMAGTIQMVVLRRRKINKTNSGVGKTDIGKDVLYSTSRVHKHIAEEEIVTLGSVEEMAVAGLSPMSDKRAISGAVMPPMYGNSASAGRLTAGEVNDFTKWALWSNVLDSTHRSYLNDWRLYARERYVVQVMGKNRYPVCGTQVSLLDKDGHVVYRAITDNTGKAELWNGLFGQPCKGAMYISAYSHKVDAKPWAEGINTIITDDLCGASDIVDVMFVFDATGSMGDELRYLQAEMRDVISRSQQAVDGVIVRTGAVVYRDKGDEYVTRLSRLTDNISVTQTFIDKQRANAGGDFPEAVPEALMAAVNSAGWEDGSRSRIVFLILDAPCHQDSLTIALLHEQLLNAAAMGIRIVPVVCSGLDKSGELLMRSIALATNGTSFFLTDDSGIGEPHLKPATDTLKVEHLNDMLVRTIVEFSQMPDCVEADWADVESSEENFFLPDPFDISDIDTAVVVGPRYMTTDVIQFSPNPCTDYFALTLPKGADAAYLVDISGKTLRDLGRSAAMDAARTIQMTDLAVGVYFVRVFVEGRWYTRKLIHQR